MPHAPTHNRTRLAAAAGLLGASAVAVLALGAGPAPSVFQLAGASDDVAGDLSGNCDEAEHAADPECVGTSTTDDGSTSTTGMPHAFNSSRNASAAASSANFDAQYGPSIGTEIRPLTLEMNTTRPRDSRSRGSAAWVTAS